MDDDERENSPSAGVVGDVGEADRTRGGDAEQCCHCSVFPSRSQSGGGFIGTPASDLHLSPAPRDCVRAASGSGADDSDLLEEL